MHLQGRARRWVLRRGLCSASRTVWLHLLVSAFCETARPANTGTARGSPHRAQHSSDQGLQGWGCQGRCHTAPQALPSHCPADVSGAGLCLGGLFPTVSVSPPPQIQVDPAQTDPSARRPLLPEPAAPRSRPHAGSWSPDLPPAPAAAPGHPQPPPPRPTGMGSSSPGCGGAGSPQ